MKKSGIYCEDDDEEEWDEILSGINENDEATKRSNAKEMGHTYNYNGVTVHFPYKAYHSQEQMMEKVIEGAFKGHNCLLESPTGTGKTAALLCSLLAWRQWCVQNQYYCHDVANKAADDEGNCKCGLISDPENTKVIFFRNEYWQDLKVKAVITSNKSYFTETSTGQSKENSPSKIRKTEEQSLKTECIKNLNELCKFCIKKYLRKHAPPKIYYATRTHSQIAQVVKQLKQTFYAKSMMTILSSRQQTCINENLTGVSFSQETDVATSNRCFNIDEKCIELKKNYLWNKKQKSSMSMKKPKEVCPYFAEPPEILSAFKVLQNRGAWDIEELVAHGSSCEKCAFYGGHALHQEAHIIFCPYNYLISPEIRASTKVVLSNNIIVFDEAHNLEDICRDAASCCIDHDQLDRWVRVAFDEPLKSGRIMSDDKASALRNFSSALQNLSSWMLSNGERLKIPTLDSKTTVSFLGLDIVKLFSMNGLGPETLEAHINYLDILKDETNDEEQAKQVQVQEESELQMIKFKVAAVGIRIVTELLRVLKYMFDHDMEKLQDYKVILVNAGDLSTIPISFGNNRKYNFILDIICLNPAVAFESIKNAAHSIIVASGTLTPLNSFATELNTPFQIKLSASHVVSRSQVWAGVVKCGPSEEFLLSKRFQEQSEIQDEIGNAILQISEIVPHGVLVFLPSYSFMNKLKSRWSKFPQFNPLLSQLRKLKVVYFEETNKNRFKNDMKDYMENIKSPNSRSGGCILFAVFRGKVSEGIDFADNQARAVITVGIPYSSCVAYEIVSKMAYNDSKLKQYSNSAKSDLLLSGGEWYKIQAFRAMNQGFGRCIRHKDDWGAVIMLEARLTASINSDYLSKWVLEHLKTYESFTRVKDSLLEFVERQTQVEEAMQSLNEDDFTEMDTQPCSNSKLNNFSPCCSSKFKEKPQSNASVKVSPEKEVDSSDYSLDEFEDDGFDFDAASQAAIENLHDLPTQIVSRVPNLENNSYENNSDLVTQVNESLPINDCDSDTSVDMFPGTP